MRFVLFLLDLNTPNLIYLFGSQTTRLLQLAMSRHKSMEVFPLARMNRGTSPSRTWT